MSPTTATAADASLANLDHLLPDLQTLYADIHSHPELSMEENRTAGKDGAGDARLRPRHACDVAGGRHHLARAGSPLVAGNADGCLQPAEEIAEGAQAMIDDGKRGRWIIRRRVAFPVGVLIHRRDRSRPVREGQSGQPPGRAPDQSQPALCAGYTSNVGDGRGGIGGCSEGLASVTV